MSGTARPLHDEAVEHETNAHMAGVHHALQQILQAIRYGEGDSVLQIAVLDRQVAERELRNWPIAGCHRYIAQRTGSGSDSFALAAGTPLEIATGNEARIGGQIVNSGASAVILYLTDSPGAGAPAIWLAAGGGSWDFKLGNVLWAGNVTAIAQGGASSVTVAEV